MFLIRVVKQLESDQIPYAIAGGYALALHGVIRATVDIDLLLNLRKNDFVRFQQAMTRLGLQSRLPLIPEQVIEFREDYISKRNLVAWSFVNFKNPIEIVDVLLMEDLAKVETQTVEMGPHKVRVVTVPELIRMKLASGRPQDLIDVENLRGLNEKK